MKVNGLRYTVLGIRFYANVQGSEVQRFKVLMKTHLPSVPDRLQAGVVQARTVDP